MPLRTYAPKAFGAWLEVGDQRFNSSEIQRLYEASDYPLGKPEQATEYGPPFRQKLRNFRPGFPVSKAS